MKKWRNVELKKGNESELFRRFLRENGFKYEPSSCFDYIHFEIFCDEEEANVINGFLSNL